MVDVLIPELGEDIAFATIACWHVKVGDRVTTEHEIVELVTDKAAFNVPSPANGVVREVLYPAGESVKVGVAVARIEPESVS